jgi:ABC-type nitrate/sulfonate/bicarbonate transport system permease component
MVTPTPAIDHAHHRLRGATGSCSLGTMSVVVSVTDLTTQAAWMAGLAILALVLAGWRKNARATARIPRGEPNTRQPWEPVPIAEATTSLYKRPGLLRRLWALVAGSALAVVIGAVLAIVIAFGTGWLVITLTDLLKQ